MNSTANRLDGVNGHANGYHPQPVAAPQAGAIREQIVRLCLHALMTAEPVLSESVRITVRHRATRLVFDVTPAEARALIGPRPTEGLTDLEAALYAALTDRESKPAAVARRAGKNPHQHVYGALKSLVQKGYAVRLPTGGYRRP
jgi:hypothetical protein